MWVQSLGWEDPLEEGIRTEATQHAGTYSLKPSQMVLVVKNLPANAGDVGLIPGWGRSPGGGHGNPLQYPCLENPWVEEPDGLHSMGPQSQTQLND